MMPIWAFSLVIFLIIVVLYVSTSSESFVSMGHSGPDLYNEQKYIGATYGGSGGPSDMRDSIRNPTTGIATGLGSLVKDPRFAPGGYKLRHGDTPQSHAGHAGGETLGAYTDPTTFRDGAYEAAYYRHNFFFNDPMGSWSSYENESIQAGDIVADSTM